MTEQPRLTIIQYNVAKSRDSVMAEFLRDPRAWEADIIAIQEPLSELAPL